jgi:uncharacterized protein (DUF983 family)
MDNPVEHRNRTCPACGVATVTLPLFATRRRHPVTCTNCGARLERVFPGVPYYTLSFIVAILIELAVPASMLLALLRRWDWIAVTIVGGLIANLAASAFLNARTRVEFVDPADARRDQPGRWYPN